jgi:hypothetical protein
MNVELLFRLHLAGPHGLPVRAAGEEPGSSVNGRCAVANKRHDTRAIRGWLGHVDLSTAVYTALAPNHFKDCWRD